MPDGDIAATDAHPAPEPGPPMFSPPSALLESIRDGFFSIDHGWRFTYFNAACERFFGVKREGVLGRRLQDAFPHVVGTPIEATFREVMQTRRPVERELPSATWPGRWIAFRITPSQDGLSVLFSDDTEQRQTREALRASEERYRRLFESMTEGFALCEIICDDAGRPCDYRYLEVNPAFTATTGLAAERVVGRTYRQALNRIEPHWLEFFGRVALHGESGWIEGYNADTGRWYSVYAFQPAPGQFGALFTDTTSQRRYREALQDSEERLRTALWGAKAGTWDWHIPEDHSAWSPQFYEIVGIDRDVAPSYRAFLALVHPEDVSEVQRRIDEAAACGGELSLEFRREHPVLGLRWIAEYGRTIRDDAGRPIRMSGIALDVTARRLAEERLEALNRKLEQRVQDRTAEVRRQADDLARLARELTQAEQKARQRLAHALHDGVQQVLVAARMKLDGLRAKLPDAQRAQIEAAQALISESVAMTRELAVELCPPVLRDRGLAAALAWAARRSRQRHGLDVRIEVDAPNRRLSVDLESFLFETSQELLLNVAKHAGTHEATVRLELGRPDRVMLTVSDGGAGCDAGRVVGDSRDRDAFGLFSIRQRARLLGGRFDIISQPGDGCHVEIELPTAPGNGAPAKDAPANDGPGNGETPPA